jgi:hypothetical protein
MMKSSCWLLLVVALGCRFESATSFTVVVVAPLSSSSIPTTKARIAVPQLILKAKNDDDDAEFVKVPRGGRRRQRFFNKEEEDDEFYDQLSDRVYDDDDDDEDWDDDDDEDDDEEYGLFSDVIIDNPLLDSIDPDGAAERFPELAADPRFWLDMVLFIAFLNFLSDIGPQDYFPDIPWSV